MDIVKRPGKAFYPEEHGVPHYEELIYIINKNYRNEIKFKKFLNAVQKATVNIVNEPNKTWIDFANYKKGLNDELNKRAYRDTVRRFTLRPSAYDLEAYKVFQNFLYDKKIIKKRYFFDQHFHLNFDRCFIDLFLILAQLGLQVGGPREALGGPSAHPWGSSLALGPKMAQRSPQERPRLSKTPPKMLPPSPSDHTPDDPDPRPA